MKESSPVTRKFIISSSDEDDDDDDDDENQSVHGGLEDAPSESSAGASSNQSSVFDTGVQIVSLPENMKNMARLLLPGLFTKVIKENGVDAAELEKDWISRHATAVFESCLNLHTTHSNYFDPVESGSFKENELMMMMLSSLSYCA